jgi:uracil-DNA glycosylase
VRPLLVGEAPARGGNRAPLDGSSGDRLARMAGMAGRVELLERFDAVNLLGRWPGPAGKGAAWPSGRAVRAAARRPLRGVAVLLGSRVARAYGLDAAGWWTWVRGERFVAVVVPHPSGVNQLYNSLEVREATGAALAQALRRAGGVGSETTEVT